MLDPALVQDSDDKLAVACAAVAKSGDGATHEEQRAIKDIICAVTDASRMLLKLNGLRAPAKQARRRPARRSCTA